MQLLTIYLIRDNLLFQNKNTFTSCDLMGQAQAGRCVVPWLRQHEGEVRMEENLPLQQQDSLAQEDARTGPPRLVATFEFDRTRQVRSTPWRLSGARVQLVDCTDPRLRGMEGVVQGWEQESGRILVQVQNLLVRVAIC